MTDAESGTDPTGDVSRRYRIRHAVHSGSQGRIFLAEDAQNGQMVALKVAHSAAAMHRRPLEQEAAILERLQTPAAVRLLDRTEVDTMLALVIEYVDGLRLDRHASDLRLPIDARCQLFLLVCDAVEELHRSGVVHCDLNPSNVMVSRGGAVKIVDFASAFVRGVPADDRTGADHRGTPRYGSPEQQRQEPLDERTDVYSLGAILYQQLCGCPSTTTADEESLELPSDLVRVGCRVPVDGDLLRVTPELIAHARSTTTDEIVATLRSGVEQIALKALHPDLAGRYASPGQLGEAVAAWLAGPRVG